MSRTTPRRRPALLAAAAACALALAGASAGVANAAAAAGASGTAGSAHLSIPNYLVSALRIDRTHNTVTLPLYRGTAPGRGTTWFVVTESSDLREAVRLGVNWSPKLVNALGTAAVQPARLGGSEGSRRLGQESVVAFSSGVDFSGTRVVVPGPSLFPVDPATHAGPVGDAGYSPLFTTDGRVVYNGPQVANLSGQHGKVL